MLTQTALHRLNNILSFFVVALAFYILFTPFVPEVKYNIAKAVSAAPAASNPQNTPQEPNSHENRLIIPAIGVDAPILEGDNPDVLDKGIWHRPHTSTPDVGSNTVLVGHRFLYTSGPTTFYLLPKLSQGDQISLQWDGKNYRYNVISTEVVPPTAIEIEAPTTYPQLTLYTCTPLWNPTQRFVIKAIPVL